MRSGWMGWKRWLGLGRATPNGSYALSVDETFRLPRDGAVRVEAGVVVITRQGDPVDHVLEAGDALELAGRGAVAWALAPSRIAVGAREAAPALLPLRQAQEERGGRQAQGWREAQETSAVPLSLRRVE